MALTTCAKCKREWQAESGHEPCPWCKVDAAEEALRAVIRSATHVDAINVAGRYLAGHAPATSPKDAEEFEQRLQAVYGGGDDE